MNAMSTSEHDALVRAVQDILNAFDDGPQFCTGTESSGRLVWKGSFITFMKRARALVPTP